MKTITLDWMRKRGACEESIKKFIKFFGDSADAIRVLYKIQKEQRPDWEGWLLAQNLELTKYLHKNGADICKANNVAIILAAQEGHLELVIYLAENGADAHVDNNRSARVAGRNGHMEVCRYLEKF